MKKKILIVLAMVVVLFTGSYYFADNKNQNDYIVYETEVDSEEECTVYEKYNAENLLCYYECEYEDECAEIQASIDDEMSTWADELEDDKSPNQENSDEVENSNILVKYDILKGEKIVLVDGDDIEEYQNLWKEVADLSPLGISDNFLERFEIFDNPNVDTEAFVDDEDGNGKWRMGINLSAFREITARERKATIIHELAHVISLNTSQVSTNLDNCQTLKLDEGCSNQLSYINIFYNKFWKNLNNPTYDQNKYVTEYATTNETEDFAESFSFFVLEKNAEFLGNLVKDEKIKMFYNFPELVNIRKDMRKVLGVEIIRARKK